jgi:hypothetical protein
MSSFSFLQNCSSDEVTLDKVLELVGQNLPEGISLEYKSEFSSTLVESIAAFANTYGGILIVGVKNRPGDDRIVGVDEEQITRISNACTSALEPPFVPEIIPVRLDTDDHLYLLIIRVYPETSPRPVVVSGKVFIRLPGRNARADSNRIRQLFSETVSSTFVANSYISAPDDSYEDPPLDVYIRTGLVFPINPSTAGRPFPEQIVGKLVDSLNGDPVIGYLTKCMLGLGLSTSMKFHKQGFNRSRSVRLAWQAVKSYEGKYYHPVEAIFTLKSMSDSNLPPSSMFVTLDIKLRKTSLFRREHSSQWGLDSIVGTSIPELFEGIEAALKAISNSATLSLLADIAGIEPYQIPRPMSMHVLMPYGVSKTLNNQNLQSIPESGFSGGALLLGDVTLDLSNETDLTKQIDQWMNQIALDAGLEGMESLLQHFHRQTR